MVTLLKLNVVAYQITKKRLPAMIIVLSYQLQISKQFRSNNKSISKISIKLMIV